VVVGFWGWGGGGGGGGGGAPPPPHTVGDCADCSRDVRSTVSSLWKAVLACPRVHATELARACIVLSRELTRVSMRARACVHVLITARVCVFIRARGSTEGQAHWAASERDQRVRAVEGLGRQGVQARVAAQPGGEDSIG
jgi:hypothetical protein